MVTNEKIVKILKAVADEKRLKMLKMLSSSSLCSDHFVNILEISQPNVSHHLKILKEAELIDASKRGRWIDYSLNQKNIALIKNEVNNILKEYKQNCKFAEINSD